MTVTLEAVAEAEYPEVFRLMEEAEYLEQALRWLGMTREQYRERIRSTGQVRSVRVDGERAGFVWTERRDRVLHVHGLVLAEGFRGRGVGSEVFRLLEEESREAVDAMELGVHLSNEGALHLYRRLGFREVKRLEAIGFAIMRRPLR